MIYLDTSAFIKLYLHETGSAEVHGFVVAQQEPPPVWHLTELEFLNALRFKVFLAELSLTDVEQIVLLHHDRKRNGQYFASFLDPVALQELCLQMTERTPVIGCRAFDIMHVAAARLCDTAMFITADKRQAALAESEGRVVKVVSSS